MTSLLTARRRAEEFAALVDGERGPHEARDARFADLVPVVGLLRETPEVDPRPEFAADLRSRLMAEADSELARQSAMLTLPARSHGVRERRLVAAASAIVLIGGTATMAAAAQGALPGEALYPVKRGIERAEAQFNMSQAGKGADLLTQARHRLNEVRGLLADGSLTSDPQVPGTLNQFAAQASEGSDLLFASFRETRDADSVNAVRDFTSAGISELEAMAGTVPPEADGELLDAAMLLRAIDEQAALLCSTCGDGSVIDVPDVFLARAEVERAFDSLAAAPQGLLDNSHPVIVPKGLAGGADDGPKVAKPEREPGKADGPKDKPGKDDGAGNGNGLGNGAGNGLGNGNSPLDDLPVEGPGNAGNPGGLLPSIPDLLGSLTGNLGDSTRGPGRGPDGAPDGGPGADSNAGPDRGSSDESNGSGNLVRDLTDGLSGAVETLLPDPDPEQPGLLGGLLQ